MVVPNHVTSTSGHVTNTSGVTSGLVEVPELPAQNLAKRDSVKFVNENEDDAEGDGEDVGLNKEQIEEREAYLEEIRVALKNESERLEQRIGKTLERFNSDDSNAPLLKPKERADLAEISPAKCRLQRCRSYSSSDVANLKRSKRKNRKASSRLRLKRDPSQTLPSSPADIKLSRKMDLNSPLAIILKIRIYIISKQTLPFEKA